jgi:histidinol phosphatase-like enzyme
MKLNQAVFLDRDGVINRPIVIDGTPYPPRTFAEFEVLPGVAQACADLKTAGYFLVVVTNQPDVGRGTLKKEAVEADRNQTPVEVANGPIASQVERFRFNWMAVFIEKK